MNYGKSSQHNYELWEKLIITSAYIDLESQSKERVQLNPILLKSRIFTNKAIKGKVLTFQFSYSGKLVKNCFKL